MWAGVPADEACRIPISLEGLAFGDVLLLLALPGSALTMIGSQLGASMSGRPAALLCAARW